MDNNVFRGLSYGVYLITAPDGERPTGCVANSLIQVTSSPATVALSLNHDNYTNGCVAKGGKFGVTILAEDSDPSLIGRFGFASGRDTDKFQGLDYTLAQGVPLPKVKGCGWLVCQVSDKLETDTHTVFLAKVLDGEPAPGTPMTYAYYHQVIKGSSPKNAPTYLPPDTQRAPANAPARWQCGVCGYIYDGDTPFEELGEDYRCPVCRQPKSVFKKI